MISSKVRLPTTVLYTATARDEAYESAKGEIEAGRQGYIVLPQRGGKDIVSLTEALSMAKGIRERYFPDSRIGVYCSNMAREERLKLFSDFQSRRIDLLLCASAIEDAPKVGNASVMLIEYADKHTLQRIRRLQGHICTAYFSPCCRLILGPDPLKDSIEQLQLASSVASGFQLAEQELEMKAEELTLKNIPPHRWGGPYSQRMRAREAAHHLSLKDVKGNRWPELNQALSSWSGKSSFKSRPKRKRRRYKR